MSKKTRSRSGTEKKAKLRRRTAKLRKRAWDFVDAFARSGSGVLPPNLFGYGNERAHRWAMINRARWWKRPLRTRGNRRKIDWAHLFDMFQNGPTLAEAIARRLRTPAPSFGPDYGLPIHELILAPGETREIEMFGRHGTLRMLDHEMAEVVLIDRPKLEKIDVTIGFAPGLELAPDPVDLTIGTLDIEGARLVVPSKSDGDPKK